MNEPLRLAVIGAGIMGTNHARVSRQVRGVELVAVVDPDAARATAAAAHSATARSTAHLTDVLGEIDAAVIAVPTPLHVETACRLADAGVHMLVEKPLAGSVRDAVTIVDAARDAGVILTVGHVERFNAAVVELPRLLEDPIHIEASRISPYSARVRDGVIFDLMIHDFDIVCSLAGPDATPVKVSGIGRAVRGSTEDVATITVEFSTGLTAAFNTSRLGQQKIRSVEITQMNSVVVADLVRQDITVHRMTHHEYLSGEGTRYRQSSVVEIPFLETRGEPLVLEQQHFVDCVIHGDTPRVSGDAAVRALELAEAAAAAIG